MNRDKKDGLIGKLVGLGLLLLASWLLALLWLTPVSALLERAPLPPELRITPLDGNLFSGRLRLETPQVDIEELHYRLAPAALLRGRLAVDVQARVTGGSVNGRLSLNRHRNLILDIHEGRLLADAPLIVEQAPLPLGGVLVIEPSRLLAGETGLRDADLTLRWEDAGLQFETPVPLGRIDAQVSLKAGRLHGEIRDNGEGALVVALELSGGQTAQLSGRLQPRPDAPLWLAQSLAMMGRPDPQGAILIRQTFPLPVTD